MYYNENKINTQFLVNTSLFYILSIYTMVLRNRRAYICLKWMDIQMFNTNNKVLKLKYTPKNVNKYY